ncbi:MAG: acetylglutamate kinase, partial [Bacilli bacterium]
GFVGDVVSVQHDIIEQLSAQGWIPVISPIGIDVEGQRYNINGDIAASAIASVLRAKLCFVSDIPGIRVGKGDDSEVLASATKEELENLIETGQITGGMIPKVRAAIDGLVHDVPEVVIINGMVEGSLLDYINGKEVGTKLIAKEYINHG